MTSPSTTTIEVSPGTPQEAPRRIEVLSAASARSKRLTVIKRKIGELPKITEAQRRELVEMVISLPILRDGEWK